MKPDASSAGLDFDLGIDVPAAAAQPAPAPAVEASSFDFDLSALSLDEPSHLATQKMTAVPQEQLAKTNAPAKASSSFGDLSLDLDVPAASNGADSGAAGTKLELAKAYVEIGDSDGAKEILQEVLREGSAAQQSEANKLLASL